MAGMLLFVVCLYPIYKAMQQAAGNNAVAASSPKNRVTSDIHFTPLMRDVSSDKVVPPP